MFAIILVRCEMLQQERIPTKKQVCEKCGVQFEKKWQLNRHLKQTHAKIHKCTHCNFSTDKLTSLQKHKHVKHPQTTDVVLAYECLRCPRSFASLYTLKKHMLAHENVVYDCEMCHVSFKLVHEYNAHVKICAYTCAICLKKFQNKFKFREHKQTHRVTLVCFLCLQTFNDLTSFREHIKHVCPLKCPECAQTFDRKSRFLKHINRKHKNYVYTKGQNHLGIRKLLAQPPPPTNKFRCSICEKKFSSSGHWYEHELTTHECNRCGERVGPTDRLEHAKQHKPQGVFKCFFCNLFMYSSFDLIQHSEQHRILLTFMEKTENEISLRPTDDRYERLMDLKEAEQKKVKLIVAPNVFRIPEMVKIMIRSAQFLKFDTTTPACLINYYKNAETMPEWIRM